MKKYEVRYGIRENDKIIRKRVSFDYKKQANQFVDAIWHMENFEYSSIHKNF